MSRPAPSGDIETFPNPQTGRDYTIRMRLPEFTCLCPRTGQPDFATLDLEYVPSAANFILVRVGEGQKVFDAMQKLGVITRPMGGYQLPEWVRISIGTAAENTRGLAALKAVMGK